MSKDDYLESMGIEIWKLRSLESDTETETAAESELDPISTKHKVEPKPGEHLSDLDLESVANIVAGCEKCVLSKTRTNTVFGSGSENADIMFIGEGPGRDEDLQGLPFVGRAGKLLTAMISALGYSREEVYICNVVKCRPPNNRDPRHQEANACSIYLRRQIELISPKVIVALGRISAQLLLDTELPLARLRGKTHQLFDLRVNLIVTYHPAYLLRRPSEKSKAWEDLWIAHQFLKN